MENNWHNFKLGGICLQITDGSHLSPKSVKLGMPMASVKDMKEYNFDVNNCRKISKEDYLKLVKNNCKPKVNDVLLAKDGNTYLDSSFVITKEEDIVILSSIAILRPNTDIVLPEYLNYFLKDKRNKQYIKDNFGSGSAIPRIVLKDIKKIPILLPTLYEQSNIVKKLIAFDNKIELNNEMNKTLEEMAQAIFKSWFVDFEPFKDGEFEESELGMIPKGWKVDNINSIVDATDYVANGSFAALKQNVAYSEGEGYAVLIRLVDYNKGFNEPFKYVDKKGYEFLKKSKLFGGEIIISNVGANAGTVFKAPKLDVPMTLGPNSIMLIPNNYSNYLYLFLTSRDGQEKLKSILSGSAQPKFNKTDFRNIKVVIPPIKIIKSFNNIINPFMDKFELIWHENRQLEQIRDALLPKLISGEIKL